MQKQETIIHLEDHNYIIDLGHANQGSVKIVRLIGNGFAIIKDSDSDSDFEWVVKLNRLTEIEPERKELDVHVIRTSKELANLCKQSLWYVIVCAVLAISFYYLGKWGYQDSKYITCLFCGCCIGAVFYFMALIFIHIELYKTREKENG